MGRSNCRREDEGLGKKVDRSEQRRGDKMNQKYRKIVNGILQMSSYTRGTTTWRIIPEEFEHEVEFPGPVASFLVLLIRKLGR